MNPPPKPEVNILELIHRYGSTARISDAPGAKAMTTDDTQLLAEGKALAEKATPGDWGTIHGDTPYDEGDPRWMVTVLPKGYLIAIIENGAPGDTVATEGDNAKFIAWLKNNHARLTALAEEGGKWKANHDNQVALRRALMDRPDLKERAALVERLAAERDAWKAEAEKWRELNDNSDIGIEMLDRNQISDEVLEKSTRLWKEALVLRAATDALTTETKP